MEKKALCKAAPFVYVTERSRSFSCEAFCAGKSMG